MAENTPTIRTNKGVRFYNAGDRMSEPMNYSIPNGSDIHCVARFVIEAPEKEFFFVPTEIRFLVDNTRVNVDFATTICQKFKDRGIVMIDEEYSPGADDDEVPIARTDSEAKEKGDRIWREYLWAIVRRWKSQCQEIKARGGVPEEAKGFTKRALGLVGMKDPALFEQEAIVKEQSGNTQSNSGEVVALQSQVSELTELVNKLLAGKKKRSDDAIEKRTSARRAGA